jgi:hypothetical protein
MHRFATENRGPELRECGGLLAIHYDLINPSNHFLSLPPCRKREVPINGPRPSSGRRIVDGKTVILLQWAAIADLF